LKSNAQEELPFNQHMRNIKTGFILFIFFCPGLVFCQTYKGMVLTDETREGIGFVNVGIIGKNVGTVTDQLGNFVLFIDSRYDNDSLRFSLIGYLPRSYLVRDFREDPVKEILLKRKLYDLNEVTVTYHRAKSIRLGVPVESDQLKSGFSDNELGSEMGIKLETNGKVRLEDINLNVATCTYDSVTYRLNIYQCQDKDKYVNILQKPIYLTFSKDKIKDAITLDLRKYSIIIEGNVLITLELYKDLGEGRLLFRTQFFTGTTYHRKTSEGSWMASPGLIGMYLHGQLINGSRQRSKTVITIE
jgi:hypothetical protein